MPTVEERELAGAGSSLKENRKTRKILLIQGGDLPRHFGRRLEFKVLCYNVNLPCLLLLTTRSPFWSPPAF